MKDIWYYICRYLLVILSDKAFSRLCVILTSWRFHSKARWVHFRHPQTFTDHINVLKINKSFQNGTVLADKLLVRDFVKEKIGEAYLIPLLGVYTSAQDIDFDHLPEQFVLKTNHGSGWNVICEDKSRLNQDRARRQLSRWLKRNAFYLSREYQYKDIPPRIICEQFLSHEIMDYKFFCFQGQPRFVQLDSNRFTHHTRDFVDMQWSRLPFSISYSMTPELPKKPVQWAQMVRVAATLAENTNFMRVDLYLHEAQIFFGEMTLCPGGGADVFFPSEYDKKMGELFL